ncbi:hypothetical protein L1987_36628 [Smallanthus sonchifolius]|uniref:Uncharacterized protein n=1 Tax=Smallanthus sonchifolius TaxID=185202 RepID=A0ACB9HDP0_9ASTR|nr:hypothetical protein L1987_36628 [Smallanthus sonchifolius]
MTRETRVVSIKTVAKDERVGPAMKHIDSPRPFPPQKPIQYDRIDRNLRELKETARFSCDGRESRYQLKTNLKIKELPRLSLDSRQGYISNSGKRPSSSVVARLMGLEALTTTTDESKNLKTNTCSNEELVLNSRSSRKEDKLKHDCTSVSPKVQKPQRGVKVSHVITRIPLETAPWKQEGGGRGAQKPPFKIKEGRPRAEPASRSIYDEIEKRLTEHEYKTAGKDLRALKQILEAMQKTKKRLENKEHALDNSSIDDRLSQKVDQPVSPTISQRKSNFTERLTDEKSTVDHAKHTMEQPSPVSVLDAFYTEDTPSPVKKKYDAFNDVENLHFEEAQDQSRMTKLQNSTNLDQYSEFNAMKLEGIKNLVHQIELMNTNTEDATVNHTVKSSWEGEIEDHKYVEEIILASGCLKDLDNTTTIVQLQPTAGLINPGLFHVLEKTKACTKLTGDGYSKNFMISKTRRKLVFDTVNDVLSHKLAMLGLFGPNKGRILNGDKLLQELYSEIDCMRNISDIGIYDEDDEVTNIINADVNKRSQDWDEYCHQVPGVVLDIERLIFKDLISEVVNFQATGLQDWPVRTHCRRLFTM